MEIAGHFIRGISVRFRYAERTVSRTQKSFILFVAIWLHIAFGLRAGSPVLEVKIDFRRTNGTIRALHGVNKGPLASGGTIDLTEAYRSNQIPFIRLHDCMWPYPDVIDVHAIFRNPSADPENPA